MVGLFDLLAAAGAGQGIGAELGAVTFDQVGDVNTEAQSAAVQEGNVQLIGAGFAQPVLLLRYAGAAGHFRHAQTGDLPQLADSTGHFLKLIGKAGNCGLIHICCLLIFETSKNGSSQR